MIPAGRRLVFDVQLVDALARDILKAGGISDLSDTETSGELVVAIDSDITLEDIVSTFVKGVNKVLLLKSASVLQTDVVCRLIKEL